MPGQASGDDLRYMAGRLSAGLEGALEAIQKMDQRQEAMASQLSAQTVEIRQLQDADCNVQKSDLTTIDHLLSAHSDTLERLDKLLRDGNGKPALIMQVELNRKTLADVRAALQKKEKLQDDMDREARWKKLGVELIKLAVASVGAAGTLAGAQHWFGG